MEGHLNNVIDAVWRMSEHVLEDLLDAEALQNDYMMGTRSLGSVRVALRAYRCDHRGTRMPRQANRTLTDSASTTLHQYDPPLHWSGDMHGAMCSDARDSQAGTLLERHSLGQRDSV